MIDAQHTCIDCCASRDSDSIAGVDSVATGATGRCAARHTVVEKATDRGFWRVPLRHTSTPLVLKRSRGRAVPTLSRQARERERHSSSSLCA
jgi:hypothetical protein